jgi:hypothetical protein
MVGSEIRHRAETSKDWSHIMLASSDCQARPDRRIATAMADVFQKTADGPEPGGHLDPAGFDHHITNYFYPPPAELEPFISHFWLLKWDRAGGLP